MRRLNIYQFVQMSTLRCIRIKRNINEKKNRHKQVYSVFFYSHMLAVEVRDEAGRFSKPEPLGPGAASSRTGPRRGKSFFLVKDRT